MSSAADQTADVILAGGGLANSLIALGLKRARPTLRVVMLERAAARDASHTWSFFQTDLSPWGVQVLMPLVAASWPAYEMRFPRHRRTLTTPYASLASDGLGQAVEAALGADLQRGVEVAEVSPQAVGLADGRRLTAPLVIDGRGAGRPSPHLQLAWQKFVGMEVRLSRPHGLTHPVVMDATVAQLDGYRFVYLLPFSADTLLIEDTRYSDGPGLADDDLRAEIRAYAADQGWEIAEVLREERGVLPITLGGDLDAYLAEHAPGVPLSGMRAALFHPTTGYSLPDAAALAEAVAGAPVLTSAAIFALVQARSRRLWRERGFFRALNRMLFLAAEPAARYRILQRFYRLPQPLIERFYAGSSTLRDQLRVLVGEPPVSIRRALKALPPSAARRAAALGERRYA